MRYGTKIAAIPTTYGEVRFRSRLEARWAAFFDLMDWRWSYEPIDLVGWTPDFLLAIPCGHSECTLLGWGEEAALRWRGKSGVKEYKVGGEGGFLAGSSVFHRTDFVHELYVEVKPYFSLEEFKGTCAWHLIHSECAWDSPSPAVFGINPEVTHWVMAHGPGGGEENLELWLKDEWRVFWKIAGNRVQWRRPT